MSVYAIILISSIDSNTVQYSRDFLATTRLVVTKCSEISEVNNAIMLSLWTKEPITMRPNLYPRIPSFNRTAAPSLNTFYTQKIFVEAQQVYHLLKCCSAQTRFLRNYSTDYYDILNVARTKEMPDHDEA